MILGILVAVATVTSADPPARPPQDDRALIMATLQRLTDGMRTRDTALLRSAFVPGAKLLGMRPRRDGPIGLQILTEQEFADFVARDQRAPWVERLFDPEVRIEGTLATVWAAYDFHFGSTFSHCGIDAFQMLKTADGWRIVSLADTFQREGCSRRPAP